MKTWFDTKAERNSNCLDNIVNASPEALAEIATSCLPAVLARVAESPYATAEILVVLAGNPDRDVRVAVAENRLTPMATLFMLAQDRDEDVRFALAENHYLPARVLEILVNDNHLYVSWRALATLRRIQSGRPGPLRCAA